MESDSDVTAQPTHQRKGDTDDVCQNLAPLAAVIIIIGLLPGVAAAQGIANYSPVTDQRLPKPEPHNWLMYRGTYDGWGYSPLDKINATNVKKLVPVWSLSTGVIEGHQAPPIVNDGVMFITTPQNQVFALDAKTRRSAVAPQARVT